jgi:hypothetical protein
MMIRTRARNKRLLILLSGIVLLLVFVYSFCSILSTNSNGNSSSNLQSSAQLGQERPTILFWTKVFNGEPYFKDRCPVDCILTTNHSMLKEASAVVFHAHDIDNERQLPKPSNPEQKFVFMSQEASPSLNLASKGRWWKRGR